jgi:hypothetical protein
LITFLQLNYDLIVAAFALLGIYWIAFTYLIEIRGILITTFVAAKGTTIYIIDGDDD